jgi:hypothetical protein
MDAKVLKPVKLNITLLPASHAGRPGTRYG